jgi:4-hydroxy-tetrahydrodipicolinate synthase
MDPYAHGWHGIWPAVLTPLTETLDVDHALLAAHCRRLLDAGCAGITLFGTTGEGPSFSVAEREQALERLIASGIPARQILASTSCAALPDTVTLTRHAVQHGCAACLILPPFFLKGVRDQGVIDAYEWVITQVNDPRLKIMLYHIPQISGVGLSVEVIKTLLARHPHNIVGLKDSGCVREDSLAYAQALMPPLQVWVGNELDVQTMAAKGTAGAVSGVANLMPRLVGRLISDAGSARAPAQLERVRALLDVLVPAGLLPAFKAVMAELDQAPGWMRVRPPLVALNAQQAAELQQKMRAIAIDRTVD